MVTKTPVVRRKSLAAYLVIFVWAVSLCRGETGSKLDCHDAEGNVAPDGTQFIPDKKDPCQTCHCDNGFSIMCTAVSCSPPACIHKAIEGKCCEFVCLDHYPTDTRSPGRNGTGGTRTIDTSAGGITNLGLRLAASTITSFLVLALLLFMIHKLRQRRLLMTVRRLNSSRRRLEEADHDRYLPEAPPLGMMVPPYQDPPPPYSPPKPPTNIAPGEPPPPYEAINNNNSTRTTHGPLDPPPAYQGRAIHSSLPGPQAARSRRETSQPQSHAPPCNTTFTDTPDSCAQGEATSSRDPSLDLGSSVEDTRVKELFQEGSSGGAQPVNNTSSVVIRPRNNTSSSTRRLGNANSPTAVPGQAVAARDASQSLINIFGPRCIRKSGSVEIVRQSISPRNSYYMEGVSAVEALSQSLDPTLLSQMLNGVQGYSPSTSIGNHRSSSSIANTSRDTSFTPHASSNRSDSTCTDSSVSALDANERRRQFRLSNLLHSPVESVDTPSSPMSPVDPEIRHTELRSNSVQSDLSWFSVCSETGEPRKPSGVIRNDCQYPEGSSFFPSLVTNVSKAPSRGATPPYTPSSGGGNSAKMLHCSSIPDESQDNCVESSHAKNVFSSSYFSKASPTSPLASNPDQGGRLCGSECCCESCQPNCRSPGPWEKKDSPRVRNVTSYAKPYAYCKEALSKSSLVARGRKLTRSGSGTGSNKTSPRKAKQRSLGTAVSSSVKDRMLGSNSLDNAKGGFPGEDKFSCETGASIYQLQSSRTLPGPNGRRALSRDASNVNNNRHNYKNDRRGSGSLHRGPQRTHPGSLCSDV